MHAETDARLLAADVDARRRALDVSRSFIVQAPAGSGKTELLIQRYLSLLAVVERPEEVLAITFTQKAADEMRARVLEALLQARSGSVGELEHERVTHAASQAVLERSRSNGWAVELAPERLRIQTLDAFCAGVARSLPLTSGLGARPEIVQDAPAGALYRRAALATLDWLVEEGDVSAAIETVLTHLDNNTRAYVDNIAAMLAKRDQWLAMIGRGEVADPELLRKTLENGIETAIRRRLRRLRERLEPLGADIVRLSGYAAATLVEAGSDSEVVELHDTGELPPAASEGLPAWRGLAELLLTRSGGWRRTVNERLGFPRADDGEKAAWLEILAALRDDAPLARDLHETRRFPHGRYQDGQWQVLLALFAVLPVAVVELRRLFAERSATDFIEVALGAATALGSADAPGQAALLLDHRIRHLLVDEMQDTSLSQYRLLEALTGGWQPGDGRTFFCVGDPMQSIYRFRDAEVSEFVRAQHAGIADIAMEPLTLRRNFRSAENLVRWFNDVFPDVFPAKVDLTNGAVPYTPSVPVIEGNEHGCRVHPVLAGDTESEARETATVIQAVLEGSPDEQVAVLVRSRTQLPELLAALRRRAIEYDAVEIDRLSDLPEIIDVHALTRACLHAHDRAAWLALLRGPLVGLGWRELHALVLDAPGVPVWELLKDPARRALLSDSGQQAVERSLPALEAMLQEAERGLRLTVETAWYALGGPAYLETEQELTNVYRFFEIVERAHAGDMLKDPEDLLRLLDEEHVSTLAGPACRLRVMTMHKAKGLQFDHVVLPSLGRYSRATAPSVLSWLRLTGEEGAHVLLSPIGPRSELERDPLHHFIESTQRSAERLELDRLLYVACTRARRSVHLVSHLELDDDGAPKRPHAASLLRRLWPAVADAFERRVAAAHAPQAQADGQAEWLLPPSRRAAELWRPPPAPSLPGQSPAGEPGSSPPEALVPYRWAGEPARQAGVLLHRWLERFARRGEWPRGGELASLRTLTRTWAAGEGVAERELDLVCERVQAGLEGVLSDPRGRWILDGPGHAELALGGLHEGRVVSIVIDRVRIDDNEHWIIDYKTGSHEGTDIERFVEQEVDRYRPQLSLYADIYRAHADLAAVRTALYFPLLKVFREVPLP